MIWGAAMKRCGLVFLAFLLVGGSGASPFDDQLSGQRAGQAGGRDDAIAQNAAIGDDTAADAAVKVHRTIYADVLAIDQPYVINRLGASQPEGMIFVLKSDLVAKHSPVFDVELISSVLNVNDIRKEGKALVVVAAVGKVLHFRVFDSNGKMVVDTDEKKLPRFAPQILQLRNQLQGLWLSHELTQNEKALVTSLVTSIFAVIMPPTYDNFKLRPGKRPRPLVLRMNVGDVLEIHFENWLQSVNTTAANGRTQTQDWRCWPPSDNGRATPAFTSMAWNSSRRPWAARRAS